MANTRGILVREWRRRQRKESEIANWFPKGSTKRPNKNKHIVSRHAFLNRRTVGGNAYLIHEGRHKDLECPSPEPRRGDGALPHRFAPLQLAEDDDEQEEEAVQADREARHGFLAHIDET